VIEGRPRPAAAVRREDPDRLRLPSMKAFTEGFGSSAGSATAGAPREEAGRESRTWGGVRTPPRNGQPEPVPPVAVRRRVELERAADRLAVAARNEAAAGEGARSALLAPTCCRLRARTSRRPRPRAPGATDGASVRRPPRRGHGRALGADRDLSPRRLPLAAEHEEHFAKHGRESAATIHQRTTCNRAQALRERAARRTGGRDHPPHGVRTRSTAAPAASSRSTATA
jgi:hypothetical protein